MEHEHNSFVDLAKLVALHVHHLPIHGTQILILVQIHDVLLKY